MPEIALDRRRAAGFARDLENSSGRLIRYVFSDDSVGRDDHVIEPGAWDLGNFLRNPVFLWAHDQSSPPIGRVVEIEERGRQLVGSVEYLDRDVSEFADSIFRMTKGGFLNATSTSWLPIDYKRTTDKNRPGGIDFSRVELLEISQVPVPALPTALATARASGIDTGPVFAWAERLLDTQGQAILPRAELEALRREARMPRSSNRIPQPELVEGRAASDWKCAAARDLEINHTANWDGEAAATRILDAATKSGAIDATEARRGFLLYDSSIDGERGAYKEPFADIIDGKLTAVASGLRAAATRLPDVKGASDEAKAEARKVLDHYEAQMTKEADESRAAAKPNLRALAKQLRQRGLYELSSLCDLISYADYVCQCVEYEAMDEGDGSPIPARMRAWVNEGNAIIAAMAKEETDENIAGVQDRDVSRQVEAGVRRALSRLGLSRQGKAISQKNERCLRAAHDHVKQAGDLILGVVEPPDDEDPEDDAGEGGDDDEARALRARKAAARKRKIGLVA